MSKQITEFYLSTTTKKTKFPNESSQTALQNDEAQPCKLSAPDKIVKNK